MSSLKIQHKNEKILKSILSVIFEKPYLNYEKIHDFFIFYYYEFLNDA